MPKPAFLLRLDVARIVCPPSATAIPLSPFSSVRLPCDQGAADRVAGASKAPPSMPMPGAARAVGDVVEDADADAVADLEARLEAVGGVVALDHQVRWCRRLDAARVEAQVAAAHVRVVRAAEHDTAVGLLVRGDPGHLVVDRSR